MRSDIYQRMNEQTNPPPKLIEQTLTAIRPRTRGHRFVRPALALTIALILCLGGISALAVNDEAVYQFLYHLSPVLAQTLKPVREACEDQGIRMEVVSASLMDSSADIIVSLRDMTGDRLDGTIDLFDSYSINRPFDGSAGCSLLNYDATTRTAYFSIHIEEQNGSPIAGSKITFSISRLLGQKTEVLDRPIPIALDDLAEAEQQRVRLSGWGTDLDHGLMDAESSDYAVLVPQGTLCDLGGGMTVTAIGILEGRLHVQLAVIHNLDTDNHGGFTLQAADGTVLEPVVSVGFNDVENRVVPERIDYTEDVFEIPVGGLDGYKLCADYWQSGMLIEGNWQVTFQMQND